MTACVVLPWPPTAMSPNGAHGHWAGKSSAARAYKLDCWALCKAAGLAPMEAEAVEVSVIFQPPTARRYDLDNLLARIKQGLDAVAEAIGVDDSRWVSMTLERGDKTAGGAVIVHVTPSDWQPIGCAAARLVPRENPRTAATARGSNATPQVRRPGDG